MELSTYIQFINSIQILAVTPLFRGGEILSRDREKREEREAASFTLYKGTTCWEKSIKHILLNLWMRAPLFSVLPCTRQLVQKALVDGRKKNHSLTPLFLFNAHRHHYLFRRQISSGSVETIYNFTCTPKNCCERLFLFLPATHEVSLLLHGGCGLWGNSRIWKGLDINNGESGEIWKSLSELPPVQFQGFL